MDILEEKYCDLLLHKCLQVKDVDSLLINIDLKEHLPLALKIKEKAHLLGVKDATIRVSDQYDKHEILNYGYNNGYDKDLLVWNNNLIELLNYSNPKFCYLEKEDINTLNLCSQNKMKTVIPNLIIKTNPLIEVKKNVSYGSLISFDVIDSTNKELNLVINYLQSKGYKIDILSKMVENNYTNTKLVNEERKIKFEKVTEETDTLPKGEKEIKQKLYYYGMQDTGVSMYIFLEYHDFRYWCRKY